MYTEIIRIPHPDSDTESKKRKRIESRNNTKRATHTKKGTITHNKVKYEGEVNVWGTEDKISTREHHYAIRIYCGLKIKSI